MLGFMTIPDDLISDEIKQEIININKMIENKIIPDKYPDEMIRNLTVSGFHRREYIRTIMGFSLLSHSWIKPLAKWIGKRKCLEIMAGTGALSKVLSDYGVSVIPTDNYAWHEIHFNQTLWCPVINIDAVKAIETYGKNVDLIIISWATMDDLLYKCLLTMRQVNPKLILLYIGETGSCCANNEFFNIANVIIDNQLYQNLHNYQTWFAIYDKIILYK